MLRDQVAYVTLSAPHGDVAQTFFKGARIVLVQNPSNIMPAF